MTKKPRDPRVWTNREIQQDGEGYFAAQQAYRDDQKAAERKRQEDDAYEQYRKRFVEAGGDVSDARASWLARRQSDAAEAAGRAEEAALTASRTHIRRSL